MSGVYRASTGSNRGNDVLVYLTCWQGSLTPQTRSTMNEFVVVLLSCDISVASGAKSVKRQNGVFGGIFSKFFKIVSVNWVVFDVTPRCRPVYVNTRIIR